MNTMMLIVNKNIMKMILNKVMNIMKMIVNKTITKNITYSIEDCITRDDKDSCVDDYEENDGDGNNSDYSVPEDLRAIAVENWAQDQAK